MFAIPKCLTHIQDDSHARGPKLLSIKNYVNQVTDDELTTGCYQQDGATCHTSNASMREIESFFSRQDYLKKPLVTLISRYNACRLLSLGPIEGQSVQKYTPHNRTTQRRYTPRDSSRQRRHCGKKYSRIWKKRIQVCLDVKGDQFQHRL